MDDACAHEELTYDTAPSATEGLHATIRVVVADRHPIILDAVETLLTQSAFRVVGRCTDGAEALRTIRALKPDIFITELRLPRLDAVVILRELQRDHCPTHTIILTGTPEEREIAEAIRLGVRGVILKDMPSRFLVQCVEKVRAGEKWLEKRSAGRLIDQLLRRETATRQLALDLTPRELEIVRLLATGLRNNAIAAKLFVTEGTIKVHVQRIYDKLGVHSRLALTLYAQRKGFV